MLNDVIVPVGRRWPNFPTAVSAVVTLIAAVVSPTGSFFPVSTLTSGVLFFLHPVGQTGTGVAAYGRVLADGLIHRSFRRAIS